MKCYPARYKGQARKRHRTLITGAGFDIDLIEADDATENLRLSLWSWRHQIDHISQRHHKAVTDTPYPPPRKPRKAMPPSYGDLCASAERGGNWWPWSLASHAGAGTGTPDGAQPEARASARVQAVHRDAACTCPDRRVRLSDPDQHGS
ncbi:hypothetical protein ACFYSJ_26215 [Streptomyces sp. NPDC005248]